jgi:hypothetical protein
MRIGSESPEERSVGIKRPGSAGVASKSILKNS